MFFVGSDSEAAILLSEHLCALLLERRAAGDVMWCSIYGCQMQETYTPTSNCDWTIFDFSHAMPSIKACST